MQFPRPDEKTKIFFESVLPDDPQVQLKPMFGHLAAFVNGNMFAAFFGVDIMVRLPRAGREKLLHEEVASLFEPMPGRPMKEYVVVPHAWLDDPVRVRRLVRQSLDWAAGLPPKAPAARRKKKG